jgi:cbb3-type cytochrome oxidase subunit 1
VNTLEGSWRSDEGTDPVVMTAVAGTGLGVLVAVLAALAGFRSAATLVAFTPYWEAVNYGLVLGVIPLLIASWTYQALPRMTGRRIFSRDDVRRQVRLTLLGTGGLVLLLVLAGLATGYSWAGGAFTGRIFTGLAVVPGIVAVLGNLGLVAVIFLTITQGHVGTQEVLVSAGDEAEDA